MRNLIQAHVQELLCLQSFGTLLCFSEVVVLGQYFPFDCASVLVPNIICVTRVIAPGAIRVCSEPALRSIRVFGLSLGMGKP